MAAPADTPRSTFEGIICAVGRKRRRAGRRAREWGDVGARKILQRERGGRLVRDFWRRRRGWWRLMRSGEVHRDDEYSSRGRMRTRVYRPDRCRLAMLPSRLARGRPVPLPRNGQRSPVTSSSPSATVAAGDGVLVEAGRRSRALADGAADGAFLLEQFRRARATAAGDAGDGAQRARGRSARQWKGVWRWYAEEMLECCEPLEGERAASPSKWCCSPVPGLSVDARPSRRTGVRAGLKRACAAMAPSSCARTRARSLGRRATATSAPSRRCTRLGHLLDPRRVRFKYPRLGVDFGLWASMSGSTPRRAASVRAADSHDARALADGERRRAVPREVQPQEPALTPAFAAIRGRRWRRRCAARATRWPQASGTCCWDRTSKRASSAHTPTASSAQIPAASRAGGARFRSAAAAPPSSAAEPSSRRTRPTARRRSTSRLRQARREPADPAAGRASFGATDSFGFRSRTTNCGGSSPQRRTRRPRGRRVAVLLERSAGFARRAAHRVLRVGGGDEDAQALLDAAERRWASSFPPAGPSARPRSRAPSATPCSCRGWRPHASSAAARRWLPAESGDEAPRARPSALDRGPPRMREQVEAIRRAWRRSSSTSRRTLTSTHPRGSLAGAWLTGQQPGCARERVILMKSRA